MIFFEKFRVILLYHRAQLTLLVCAKISLLHCELVIEILSISSRIVLILSSQLTRCHLCFVS